MTKLMQSISTTGLLSDGFVATLFNLIELPEDGVVSAIILAYSDGRQMRLHFKPLVEDQLSSECKWWDGADAQADIYSVYADELIEEAKRRWPEVRIFVVPGCICLTAIVRKDFINTY